MPVPPIVNENPAASKSDPVAAGIYSPGASSKEKPPVRNIRYKTHNRKRSLPMAWSWLRKVGSKRVGRVVRPGLWAERLEARDTPAGLLASAVLPGNAPVVAVFDPTTNQQTLTINAFDPSFTGGVNVAVGDVTGDGTPDVVAGAGAGGGPTVEVFDGTTGALLKTLTAGDASSRAGVSVATADVTGDGKAEIVVGSILNGTPVVQVLSYADGSVLNSFSVFPGAASVSVAAGDVNGDGTPDVIAGAGTGGGPQVTAFDGNTCTVIFNRFAFEDTFRGGVGVSAADLNGDQKADVIVGAGATGGPHVAVFSGADQSVMRSFFAADDAARDGVRATGYTTGTGTPQLVTVAGTGPLKAFDGTTLAPVAPPSMPGLPAGPIAVSTGTGTGGSTGGTTVTDDSGMTNVLPDVNDPRWVVQSDGLKVWNVQTGSGTPVAAGSTLGVFYTGWLKTGAVFDSARSPKAPASFPLANLIQGWKEGLIGMQPGGIRRLYVPAALGYGSQAQGSIPANSDLVFEIKLASVS